MGPNAHGRWARLGAAPSDSTRPPVLCLWEGRQHDRPKNDHSRHRRARGQPDRRAHDRWRASRPRPLARPLPRHRAAEDRGPGRRAAHPLCSTAVLHEPDRGRAAPHRGRGVLAPRRASRRAGRSGLLLHPRQPGRRLRRRRPCNGGS